MGRQSAMLLALLQSSKVGLILGTSPKSTWNGRRNYYNHRIKAGADLYKAGKINWLVVIGESFLLPINGV